MPVPMIDLKLQYQSIKAEIDASVARVLESQQFRGGTLTEGFEASIATYVGVSHAIGVATGTDALLLALKALGVQPGDEVITTPFTFFATAGAVVNAGATPVFVDIDPATFNINPSRIAEAITTRTKAILPVHLFGQCADMNPILELAAQHDIAVLEDTAQALGAKYEGESAGSMGAAGTLSFYPTKNLGAAGEGGMVVTDDDALAERIRLLRCHGSAVQYYHTLVGTNSHLHAIQAAVLAAKLPHLDDWNKKRAEAAAYYTQQLTRIPEISTPVVRHDCDHVWHQYVIRIRRRDEAIVHLKQRGIGCGVFYPLPLHQQECFLPFGAARADCREAERASREVLALPMFAEITREQQDEVVVALLEFIRA